MRIRPEISLLIMTTSTVATALIAFLVMIEPTSKVYWWMLVVSIFVGPVPLARVLWEAWQRPPILVNPDDFEEGSDG